MNTIHVSSDSQVLGWGALTVAVLVLAAFITAARPSPVSSSLHQGYTGVTAGHVLQAAPGNG
jgi:hypothetical protein